MTTPGTIPPRPSKDAPAARRPAVLLDDLTTDLLWPAALRTPALAARPARIILGIGAIIFASLLGNLPTWWSDEPAITSVISERVQLALGGVSESILTLNPMLLAGAVAEIALLPRDLVTNHPVATFLLGIPMIAVFCLFGGTISRASSAEYSRARFTDWRVDFIAAFSKLGSLAGAIIAPFALAGILVGAIALGGILVGIPGLDILGAILYSIGTLTGLFIAALLAIHTLAIPMLVPAVMCEGTDGFDAIQRTYAYILGRPLRLLAHAAILVVIGAVGIGVASLLAEAGRATNDFASALITADSGKNLLGDATDLSATQPAAHNIIQFWRNLLTLAVAGYAVSYFFSAGSVLYLNARRICDGQDTTEVWEPFEGRD